MLRCIDKAIPLPIFYNLVFDGRVKTVAAYKHPSNADACRWLVDSYFSSPWQPADGERSTLPVALDMAGLYEQMLPPDAVPGTARRNTERSCGAISQLRSKQTEYAKLEARLHKEKQFNRKVELNSQLRTIKTDIETLVP